MGWMTGFRIAPDSLLYQRDSSENHGKTGKIIRKSATGCNQESESQDASKWGRVMNIRLSIPIDRHRRSIGEGSRERRPPLCFP